MGGTAPRTPHGALAPPLPAVRPGSSLHFPPVGSGGEGEPEWPGAGTLPGDFPPLLVPHPFPPPTPPQHASPLLDVFQAHFPGLEAVHYRVKNRVDLKIFHSSLGLAADAERHPRTFPLCSPFRGARGARKGPGVRLRIVADADSQMLCSTSSVRIVIFFSLSLPWCLVSLMLLTGF